MTRHGRIFCWGSNKHRLLGLDPEIIERNKQKGTEEEEKKGDLAGVNQGDTFWVPTELTL